MRDQLAVFLTCCRAPLGVLIGVLAASGERGLGVAALTAFVLLDMLDGMVARRSAGGDDAQRRGLDGVIDRATVIFVLAAAATQTPALLLPVVMVSVASLAAIPTAVRTYRSYGVVLRYPAWHRVWSVSLFVCGVAWFLNEPVMALVLGVIGGILNVVCTAQMILAHARFHRSVLDEIG